MARAGIFLLAWGAAMLAAPATTAAEPCMLIAETNTDDAANWWVVNDGVMGGLSRGGLAFEDTRMVFSGVLNTNGGGFSSIRRDLGDARLQDGDSIEMVVRGDGRSYELTLRAGARFGGMDIAYRADLISSASTDWQTVRMLVSDFRASFRGRMLPDRQIQPASIRSVGIILADGRDGPFRLEVQRIKICRGSAAR